MGTETWQKSSFIAVGPKSSGLPREHLVRGTMSTFDKALDRNLDTFFDAQQPNGAYVELDTGEGTPFGTPAGFDHLSVTNANGSGNYRPGQRVNVFAFPPPGQYFAGWDGFTSILDDPTAPSTYATIPGIGVDLRLTAMFKVLPPGSHHLDVEGGSGDGYYVTGTTVTVSADPPPAGQLFVEWYGDIAILSNPFYGHHDSDDALDGRPYIRKLRCDWSKRKNQVLSKARVYRANGGGSV